MSMQLVSEILLKREIKRYEENPDLMKENEAFYYMCKKELPVIEKIMINEIDMRGGIEEFDCRIDGQGIYFMEPQKFEDMKHKAEIYDIIYSIVKEK